VSKLKLQMETIMKYFAQKLAIKHNWLSWSSWKKI